LHNNITDITISLIALNVSIQIGTLYDKTNRGVQNLQREEKYFRTIEIIATHVTADARVNVYFTHIAREKRVPRDCNRMQAENRM